MLKTEIIYFSETGAELGKETTEHDNIEDLEEKVINSLDGKVVSIRGEQGNAEVKTVILTSKIAGYKLITTKTTPETKKWPKPAAFGRG